MSFDLNNKKIWVAGHTGMVGSAVVRALTKQKIELLTVSKEDLDLTRQSAVENWMAVHKPDVVINCAARVGGILANSTQPVEFLSDNLSIASNIIHSSYQHDVKKLVNIASACSYPANVSQPMQEQQILSGYLEPTNEAFAIAKIAAMKLCQYYHQQYGCHFITVIPTNSYGPNDNFDLQSCHVPAAMIYKFHQAKLQGDAVVEIWGSGTPLRDFIHVDDMAAAIIYIVENYQLSQPINIGTGSEVSIKTLAEIVQQLSGFKGNLTYDKSKPDGVARKLLDCSRLSAIGWSPQYSIENGLRQTFQWYINHQAEIF